MTDTAAVAPARYENTERSFDASARSLNAIGDTVPNRMPRTGVSFPSSVTFTIASMAGPAPPCPSDAHAADDVAEGLVLRLEQRDVLLLQLGRGDRIGAFDLKHTGEHGVRATVAVGAQEIFLGHPAGQQRHQPALLDERHVLRPHPLVVHRVTAGERLSLELRQRRRVARSECVGHHAQAGAIQERRGWRLPHARVLGVRRTPRLHHLHERFRNELRPADPFDQHRARELFADRGEAQPPRRPAAICFARATRSAAAGRSLSTRPTSVNVCRTGMPSPACASAYIVSDGELNRRDRLEAFAVQVVARAVGLRNRDVGEVDIGM